MKVKVTITTEEGEVLDQFQVSSADDFSRPHIIELAREVRSLIEDGRYIEVED